MLRHPQYTRKRIAQLADRFAQRIYPQTRPLDSLLVAGPIEQRIGYAEAMKLDYAPANLGMQLGPPWHTFWFKARATVPTEWAGRRVDLLWSTHSENTLWVHGRALQGLNAGEGQARPEATLVHEAEDGAELTFELETACNKNFGVGKQGKGAFASLSPFILDRAQIGVFDSLAWTIHHDLKFLSDLEDSLSEDQGSIDRTFAGELLFEMNRFANEIDEEDAATWPEAHRILQALFQRGNASSVHELSAIGHAHIDTAWLWPLAETTRKCQRSFGTATRYMEEYPEYKFACSQAYQYDTIERHDPDLFARIQAAFKRGQWVPVGGTWIEPDCNIPSGESLIRQFLYGQRYFQKRFGRRCREFWNPDVFGYNGQLPQIMRHCDIARFLTQKLSWNYFNKPHTHTFDWVAVDGSSVLAHFPPADTYNAVVSIRELRFNAANHKDFDRSRHSYMLFGHGDGGGGPTRQMLEYLRRARDLQGLPRTAIRSSDEFFDVLEAETKDRLSVVGELYFELHRGTYTSQGLTKRNNRYGEVMLHDLELLSAVGHRLGLTGYDHAAVDALWHTLLLNQFHDILPGSSIGQVYEDAARQFEAFFAEAEPMRKSAADAVSGKGNRLVPINTVSVCRREVAEHPDGGLVVAESAGMGIGRVVEADDPVIVREDAAAATITLENQVLRAVLDRDGRLVSLIEKFSGRQAMAEPGNIMELYDDRPTAWDAWDVEPPHLETAAPCPPADRCEVVTASSLRAEVAFGRPVGKRSRIDFAVRLDSWSRRLEIHCRADWHESHKFLKVAFPVNVLAMNATYEMQFHAVERPTHYNTSHDLARFEVPGHRWADLSEHGFGVALLTDCKYGYSTRGHRIHISLLRAPAHPDPDADQGEHRFSYAVFPHIGDWRIGGVVAEAVRFNHPMVWGRGGGAPVVWFEVNDENLLLDTVKKAEDDDGLVLRFFERHGGRGEARVRVNVPFHQAVFCNGLEDEGEPIPRDGDLLSIPYQPWKIISIKLK
ncbi:MAG: alpha-mannosidase [Phycisphaeraceae bacterium]|nr:alpha-mannosidase [Phycisphaeraceae bacterium]